MNRISSIIVLTLVMFSLVSPERALAGGDDLKGKCDEARSSWTSAKKALEEYRLQNKSVKINEDATYSKLQTEQSEAKAKYEECDKKAESQCTDWKKERKDLIEKFPPSSQSAAKNCMASDEDDSEADMSRAAMGALVGQTLQGKDGCDLGGAKTINKDKRESIDKDVEKLETANRKADADIIKKQEQTEDELNKINEDRKKAKEDFENLQEDAESAQVKAMGQLRDKQLQLADTIRKLQSAAITARQNVQSIDIEMKAAMTTAKAPNGKIVNLKSESAINLNCVAVAKQTNKENYGSGSSKNATSGASRVAALKEAYANCVSELHDMRNNIAQSFANALEQRINQQDEIAKQIESANQQYAQLTADYNKMLEQLQGKLTKAQQRYYEKDNDLANKYNQALQRGQQLQNKLQMEKMQDQQKIIAKYNTQGKLSDQDIDEIIESSDELDRVERNLIDNECQGFKGVQSTKEKYEKKKADKEDSQQ